MKTARLSPFVESILPATVVASFLALGGALARPRLRFQSTASAHGEREHWDHSRFRRTYRRWRKVLGSPSVHVVNLAGNP
jgi:hypothetical protein